MKKDDPAQQKSFEENNVSYIPIEQIISLEVPLDDTSELDGRKDRLMSLVSLMPVKPRKILQLRYGLDNEYMNCLTYEEIGLEFGLTRERIRQIIAKWEEILRSFYSEIKGDRNFPDGLYKRRYDVLAKEGRSIKYRIRQLETLRDQILEGNITNVDIQVLIEKLDRLYVRQSEIYRILALTGNLRKYRNQII